VTNSVAPDASSPAGVALASFGAGRFARIVSEQQRGDWAVVLILMNEEPHLVPYEMVFRRDSDQWIEVAGNDAPGWRAVGDDGLGLVTYWGEAPSGASQITVTYRGSTTTAALASRYFLAVFWTIREESYDPDVLPQVAVST
jgi:hypothetical protein